VTIFGTVAMSHRGGTKGVCRHVSTPSLKSVMELKKSVLVYMAIKFISWGGGGGD